MAEPRCILASHNDPELPDIPLIANHIPRKQSTARKHPQKNNNCMCSPALTNEWGRFSSNTQKMKFASERCHELPPKEENIIVSSVLNLNIQPNQRMIGFYHGSGKIAIRTSLEGSDIKYSFQMILKKRGPVESMTVK